MRQKILLREGARDNALQMFMPLFQKRGIDISISQMKQLLLRKFVNEAGIHNLSLRSNYYLLGVARYYFEGKLTENKDLNALNPEVRDVFNREICTRLNILILILRNAYIDTVGTKFEQPEDFGNLPLEKLLRKYNKKINKELGVGKAEKEEETPNVSNDYSAGNGYTYEILYSFDDAQKYYEFTEPGAWCITYGKAHYDGYVKRLGIHYVIFRQNGFEKVPRRMGNGFTKRKPHDAYGNSLIAVLQSNRSPEPIFITSRWNHGSSDDNTQGTEADHAYTTEEFLNVIGADYSVLERAYEQWASIAKERPRKNSRGEISQYRIDSLRAMKYAQMLINGGKNPAEIENIKFIKMSKSTEDPKMNGAYIAYIDLGHGKYYTIMDRKRMMLDKIFVKSEGYLCGEAKDTKVIRFKTSALPFMLYNEKLHKLCDIDGAYFFKDICGHIRPFGPYDKLPNTCKYAILAMSGNQVALVSLADLEPVKAKNGSPWFESINQVFARNLTNYSEPYRRRGISLPYRSDGILSMVYDSSSEEKYLYNTFTDSFIDDMPPENGEFLYGSGLGNEYFSFIYHIRDTSGKGNILNAYKLYNARTDRFIPLGGHEAVESLDGAYLDGTEYVTFKPFGDEAFYIFNPDTNAYVEMNGKPLSIKSVYISRTQSICGHSAFKGYDNWYSEPKYIVVNPYNNKVVTPSPDKSPFVNIVQSVGRNSFSLSNDYGEITVMDAYSEYKKESEAVNNARSEFLEIFNRLNKNILT